MNAIGRILPWSILAASLLYLAYCVLPPRQYDEGFNLADFSTLPTVYRGRVQPIDTVARNALVVVSGRQTFTDENDKTQQAARWLLEIMSHSLSMKDDKVFRIENRQVLDVFGLPDRSGFRYSLRELMPNLQEFQKRVKEAARKEADKKADLGDAKLLELDQHLKLFMEMAAQEKIYTIPAFVKNKKEPDWFTLAELRDAMKKEEIAHIPANAYVEMLFAYGEKDALDNKNKVQNIAVQAELLRAHLEEKSKDFNKALADYRGWLSSNMPGTMRLVQFEAFFNRFEPFFQFMLLYVVVFILAGLFWLTEDSALGRSAFVLGVALFTLHTFALIARMYIQGRPPVTNLYSSAIFIGWGCAGIGMGLEYVFRNGIGSAAGAVTGALSLYIAHNLSFNGDTLEMMQAVLDTNFWLATHVTCITMGYTATLLAGFIGIFYILSHIIKLDQPAETAKNTSRMIYGVLCFATLLSFTGTVLGGIWADQSWGRFWGWDPKENGALLIVLMNALILHARWGGLVKARGMAVLSVLGNIVVAWSWFGVNMLGIGLHSYGKMAGAVFWLLFFVGSQLLIAMLGLIDPHAVRASLVKVGETLGFCAPQSGEKAEVGV